MAEVEPYILTGVVSAAVAVIVRLFDTTNKTHSKAIEDLTRRVDEIALSARTLEIWREGAIAREQSLREQMTEIKQVLTKVADAIDDLGRKINGGIR